MIKMLISRGGRRGFAFLMALLIALPLAPSAVFANEPGGAGEITVYIDFEGYNLGQGFYIEPTALTLPAGSTEADATSAALGMTGHDSKGLPGYLSGVKGFGSGDPVSIPAYITENTGLTTAAANATGRAAPDWLSEMDYSGMSGWMNTVNGELSAFGPGSVALSAGDVIRWQFSVSGYGADLGVDNSGMGGDANFYTQADKTALIRALCADGVTPEAKAAALQVVINPLAQEADVLDALDALQAEEPPDQPPAPQDEWIVIDSPQSAQDMMNKINAALVSDYGQTADSYDYSVVKDLKLTGIVGDNLFNFSVSRNALSPYLVNLDMSEISGPTPAVIGGGSASTNYTALKSVTMPAGDSNGYGQFMYCSALETVVFAGQVDKLGELSYFSGCTSLSKLIFNGITAPTISPYTFIGANAPVAYVPDKTAGGYQAAAFTQYFTQVLNIDEQPAGTSLSELQALVDTAMQLSAQDYTQDSWLAFQAALTAAQSVLSDSGQAQSSIDNAFTNLQNAISALQTKSSQVTYIKVTKGAAAGVYQKNGFHFTPFTSFPLTLDNALSDADYDVYAVYGLPLGGGYDLHAEASIPGQTVKEALYFSLSSYGTTITLKDLTPLSSYNAPNSVAYDPADLYTNLKGSGVVNLPVGGTFDLDTFRVWQAMDGATANDFVEPDYAFGLSGDSVGIAAVGAPGRAQLRITALHPGVSVIKITYDPVEYVQTNGASLYFGAIDPGNTGVVVVNVGGGAAFDTGITAKNDFDTYYFDNNKGYSDFTFTPASGTSVRVHDPLNITAWDPDSDSGWTAYAANSDGSFTVQLKAGRNIIELTNAGSTQYYVVKAKGVDVAVTNETNPGQPFAAGDTASIAIKGLEEPIEKLAGVYNPGFPTSGSSAPYISYSNGVASFDSAKAAQYATYSTTFTVSYTLTDPSLNVLNGQIMEGSMGSPLGAHREIPPAGMSPNMSASIVPVSGFGALPEIVLPIAAGTGGASAPCVDYETALSGVVAYIINNVDAPGFDSVGGDWAVLALSRYGAATPSGYYDGYLSRVEAYVSVNADAGGKLDPRKSTENSRLVIALASLGVDATDFAGADLVAPLADSGGLDTWTAWQGINGAIYALIALDTKPYMPDDDSIRDELVNYILDSEISGGGFALSGQAADPDATAMAIQALAPYRMDQNVAAAIERGLTALSTMQLDDGGFAPSFLSGGPESCAQVVTALSTLGIDAQTDSRFQKTGGNPLTALLAFQNAATDAFAHISGGPDDELATEQAAYALVAYDRFMNGKNTLYDMSDVQFENGGNPAVNVSVKSDALAAAAQIAALLDPSAYTPASWRGVADALAGAIAALADGNAAQEEIDAAYGALVNAVSALKPAESGTGSGETPGQPMEPQTVNKTMLNTVVAQAKSLTQSDYTEGSWQRLKNALAIAQATATGTSATQPDIDSAKETLLMAIYSLTTKPAGDTTTTITVSTPVNTTATPSTLYSGATTLTGASAAVDRGLLNSAIDQAEGLNEGDYTEGSWLGVSNALYTARVVAASGSASQTDVNNARNALLSAIGSLVAVAPGTVAGAIPEGQTPLSAGGTIAPAPVSSSLDTASSAADSGGLPLRTLIGFIVLIAAAFAAGLFVERVRVARAKGKEA